MNLQTPPNPEFSWARLRTLCDGNERVVMAVVAMAPKQLASDLEALEQAVRGNEVNECLERAHRLKGSLLNLGAERAAAFFAQVEARAREGEIPDREALDHGHALLARVIDEVQAGPPH